MDNGYHILELFVRWIWVPILGLLARYWSKVSGVEARQDLLEQRQSHFQAQRDDDLRHSKDIRDAIELRLLEHHTAVMKRIDRVEELVRNRNGNGNGK